MLITTKGSVVKKLVLILTISLLCLASSFAEKDVNPIYKSDTEAIKATVSNYDAGWFNSDFERMEKALHPNLFKVTIKNLKDSDDQYLEVMTAEQLIIYTKHNHTWVEGQSAISMEILFQSAKIAVVHTVSEGYYDICNLAKLNGEWKIVQVIWARSE